jgi:hypothetical protein
MLGFVKSLFIIPSPASIPYLQKHSFLKNHDKEPVCTKHAKMKLPETEKIQDEWKIKGSE